MPVGARAEIRPARSQSGRASPAAATRRASHRVAGFFSRSISSCLKAGCRTTSARIFRAVVRFIRHHCTSAADVSQPAPESIEPPNDSIVRWRFRGADIASVPLVRRSPVMLAVPARSRGSTSAPLPHHDLGGEEREIRAAQPRSRASHFPAAFPLASANFVSWVAEGAGGVSTPPIAKADGQTLGRGRPQPNLPSRAAGGREGSQSHAIPPGKIVNCARSLAVYAARDGNFSVGTSCEDSLGFLRLLCRPRRFHRFRQILDHDFLFAARVAVQHLLDLGRPSPPEASARSVFTRLGVTVNHGRFAERARLAVVRFAFQQLAR